ncbi:MAG: hypothetical protein AAF224_05325 [Pseudomonadota bacterium]
MPLIQLAPLIAIAALVVVALVIMTSSGKPRRQSSVFPAILSLLFLAWSVVTIIVEGPLGFWTEHTGDLWGNQIWFDLLIAIGIGWFFIVPPAKALGMRLPLWLVFIICTGCIGFLAMLSRFLYLREKAETSTS